MRSDIMRRAMIVQHGMKFRYNASVRYCYYDSRVFFVLCYNSLICRYHHEVRRLMLIMNTQHHYSTLTIFAISSNFFLSISACARMTKYGPFLLPKDSVHSPASADHIHNKVHKVDPAQDHWHKDSQILNS